MDGGGNGLGVCFLSLKRAVLKNLGGGGGEIAWSVMFNFPFFVYTYFYSARSKELFLVGTNIHFEKSSVTPIETK